MRAKPSIAQLDRRVEALEKEVASPRKDPKLVVERARSLIFQHLKKHESIEPTAFAFKNDLPSDVVEKVLREFDRKRWTVPVDD